MNKNYANHSDIIKVGIDETMVAYSAACDNVVILFNNRKAFAGLSTITAPVSIKKDIIDMCSEMGLPVKMIYTEIDGSTEKYFQAATGKSNDELVVKQIRTQKGKEILVVDLVKEKELEM